MHKLNAEDFSNMRAELLAKLRAMPSNPGLILEYGDESKLPGSFMSALRIYYMPTMGGVQYGIKQLSHGTEHGGHYTPNPEEAADIAMRHIERYHKPHPNPVIQALLSKRLISQVTPLSWFSYMAGDKVSPAYLALANARDDVPWEGEVVTTLPAPNTFHYEKALVPPNVV